jgi:hypothetical protein
MAYFITRIKVPDYDAWKPNFDADDPGARRDAKSHRILRGVDDPSDVYILVEFASAEAAREGRERLLASGVLNRFPEHSGPIVVDSGGAG